jgi:hypothetical protein
LVIGDLGKWSLWAARRRIRSWFGAKMWRPARFRTAKALALLVAGAGVRVTSTKGAILFPPSKAVALAMAPLDPALGETTTLAAAVIAVQATKLWPDWSTR